MQVKVGHSMIEHKRPALTDSFFQVNSIFTIMLPLMLQATYPSASLF